MLTYGIAPAETLSYTWKYRVMSDFKVTQRMWNDLVLSHNKLVDKVKKLEGVALSRIPTPTKLCIRCGEKEAFIGGYCSECNITASQERADLIRKSKLDLINEEDDLYNE